MKDSEQVRKLLVACYLKDVSKLNTFCEELAHKYGKGSLVFDSALQNIVQICLGRRRSSDATRLSVLCDALVQEYGRGSPIFRNALSETVAIANRIAWYEHNPVAS